MSSLILPFGGPPAEDPPQTAESLPPEILLSVQLLGDGMMHGEVDVMKKVLDDGDGKPIYDLKVTLKHPITGAAMPFIVARLLPQILKPDPNERPKAAVPAPAAND